MINEKDGKDLKSVEAVEKKPESFDADRLIKHWMQTSDDDYQAMIDMYSSKHYNWSLFLGHLVIEKLLKALFIKNNQLFPPLIHNLLRLAEISKIELNKSHSQFFATVTTFNINARYDDYKQNFNKTCTKEFTDVWLEKIKEYRIWIKEQLSQ